ncbi:tetratricopeptide repeat protein [Crenobacter cavernae]|uniref:Sel1 repeat family protein n=1 Tax=Crenobacter cavernae TaxID=2290923 RepID=A0ABY0FFN4_9NEIS|nr:SEL1-like repeat protein [Crenobacter cavernae]RXZ43750.1 sel1 repeat family protein [Crenobacter cavernae]
MEIIIGIIVIFVAIIIFGKLKGAPDPASMPDIALMQRLQSEEAWITRYLGLPYENRQSVSLKKMYEEKTAYIEQIKLEIVKRQKAFEAIQAEPLKQDSLLPESPNFAITEKALSAAEAGDVEAQLLVGSAYLAGSNGLPQDLQKAGQYLIKAAEQNHAFASFIVAGLYLEGMGLPQDIDKARMWAFKAKALGHPDADQMLLAIDVKRSI